MIILAKPKSSPNPYNDQLYHHVGAEPGVDVIPYSTKNLLLSKYDVLHIHWPDRIFYWKAPVILSLMSLGAFLIVAHVRGAKVAYTCHNILPKNRVSRRALRAYFGLLRRYVDGVISPRADLTGRVRTLFPNAEVRFIPLGLPDIPPERSDEVMSILPADWSPGSYVLIPGVQESTKRTELAVDRLLGQDSSARIAIIGKFTEPEYFQKLVDRYAGRGNIIIRNKFLEDAELNTLIENARCAVASQARGTNSGIALLAVALHKPCFCATQKIASSVRADYKSPLVWKIEDFSSTSAWARIQDAGEADISYTMEKVGAETRNFLRDLTLKA